MQMENACRRYHLQPRQRKFCSYRSPSLYCVFAHSNPLVSVTWSLEYFLEYLRTSTKKIRSQGEITLL